MNDSYAINPWLVFSVTAMGTFMATLDSSIVNVALPEITSKLGTDISVTQWVVTAYLLVISSLLPVFGRAGDMYGQRRLYTTGVSVFTMASVLCGYSGSIWMLVISRIVQAAGASMMMANGPAIIVLKFKPHERGRALGSMGTVVAMGSVVGPALGGLLVGSFGWGSIFFVNIPVGIACFIAGMIILPKGVHKDETFDFTGSFLFAAGICSLLLVMNHGGSWGWSSSETLTTLAAGIISVSVFIRTETRVQHPMLDLSMFRIRAFTAGNLAGLFSFIAIFCNVILLPFYLATVHHLTPSQIGLVITPFPLAMGLIAPVSGHLSDRISYVRLTTAGLGMVTVVLFFISRFNADTGFTTVAFMQAMMGFGNGLFQSPNNNSVISSVPREKTGVAGGIGALMRNVGMVTGTAMSVTIFQAVKKSSSASVIGAFLRGYNAAVLTGAIFAACGVVICLNRKGYAKST